MGWSSARIRSASGIAWIALFAACVAAPHPAIEPATPAPAPPPAVETPPPVEPEAPPPAIDPPAPPPTFAAAAIRSDPPPAQLIKSSHYWISNEHSHFVWHAPLQGLGGAYLGVGTDQNYLLAGWSRPELLLLMDFDEAIVDLHRAYRVAFTASATPEAFLELWSKAGADAHAAHIVAAIPDPALQTRVLRAQRIARPLVHKRLRKTLHLYKERGIPTYLDDPAQYAHLRRLWQEDRAFTVRGDLTGDATFVDIAAALRAAGLALSVLYLSNAEQYFDYVPGFRRNVLALPMSDRSLVVRTLGWQGHGFIAGEQYHYNRQPGLNFADWMRVSAVERSGRMLRYKRATDVHGVSILDAAPVPARRPPQIAGAPP